MPAFAPPLAGSPATFSGLFELWVSPQLRGSASGNNKNSTFLSMRPSLGHVSVRGNETKQRLSLQGLRSAAGFLQAKLASRIETRYTPRLEFVLDLGVKKSIEMAQILERVLPAKSPDEEPATDDDDSTTEDADDDDQVG